jgi:hypothetical protein
LLKPFESYDPFNKKIVPATPAAPIKQRNNKKAVSPYFLLFDEKLFPIEFEHRRIEDPLLLIKSYFPLHPTDGVQQHYCPSIPYKTIQFYQNILQQEGSVEIKSIFGKTPATKNQILFHKVEIIKFTHLRDWGHPWHSKPLKNHSIEYNYYDYIDAWYKYYSSNTLICLIPGSSNSTRISSLLNQNASHQCGS